MCAIRTELHFLLFFLAIQVVREWKAGRSILNTSCFPGHNVVLIHLPAARGLKLGGDHKSHNKAKKRRRRRVTHGKAGRTGISLFLLCLSFLYSLMQAYVNAGFRE